MDQPERFPLFHAKDGVRTEVGTPTRFGWQFTDPGDGNVPLWALFNGLETDEHCDIVERDDHNFPVRHHRLGTRGTRPSC